MLGGTSGLARGSVLFRTIRTAALNSTVRTPASQCVRRFNTSPQRLCSHNHAPSYVRRVSSTAAPKIPEEQWAQVVERKGGPVTYKKVPVPKPGPDEVLVNVKYSGVCHTDLHAMNGDWPLPTKMPFIGGHEGAGVVVARGELVKDIEIGDHAGIKWLHGSCMNCEFCRKSDESLCETASLSGYTVDGTFQQYAIGNAAHVARIPKECDLAAVSPILCAGLTVYKALKESGAHPGQHVAIVGAGGGLGVFALQYAKAMGLHPIAIDGGEEKRKICEDLGAESYIDFTTSSDIVMDVKKATGGLGPDAAILLAVHEGPFQQASQYIKSKGTIVCVGLPGHAFIKAPVFDTVIREINIKGSYVGNRQDTAEAIDFFRRGLIKAPYKIVGLSELQSVYQLMKDDKITGRYVVDTSK
ncbi:GroES-like protein [Whalleya microplaca]|nr:GroES-like protein [Whalleya microplaca]